ncbi:MAG: hypothetical protein P4L83_22540 [Nevskia sp.]|nr:hypothetical protein [Nevskia sp.]
MIKAIRKSLFFTVLVMTPFILSACNDNPNDPPKRVAAIVPFVVIFVVRVAVELSRTRKTRPAAIPT